MSRRVFIAGYILLGIVCLLTLPYLWQLLKILFAAPSASILQQLECYKWAALGAVIYLLVYRRFKDRIKILETDTHEHLHMWVALLVGRRIHSVHAERDTGVMSSSGTSRVAHIPVSLAPYCFPLFTFALLAFRFALDFRGRGIYDIIVGFSLAFHLYCVKNETGNHQTDINQYPLPFSYLYIFTAWLINTCLILAAFFPNMNMGYAGHASPYGQYGLWSSIARWVVAMWDNLTSFISWLF